MQQHILVVDDDPGIRCILEEVLQHEGYQILLASNGQEALNLMQNGPLPQLIILDLAMPVMDGWEFMEQQKAQPALRFIPLLIITGLGPSELNTSLDCPSLTKPFDIDELLELTQSICKCSSLDLRIAGEVART